MSPLAALRTYREIGLREVRHSVDDGYPLLRHLGLALRRPYQSRHTAATLWLAAGENPLWIARQMGHTSTEMLFKVYGRFVPNLTRSDGSAFERLLLQSGAVIASVPVPPPDPANTPCPPAAAPAQVEGI